MLTKKTEQLKENSQISTKNNQFKNCEHVFFITNCTDFIFTITQSIDTRNHLNLVPEISLFYFLFFPLFINK